ncbi:hypothetical protein B0H15DRAFT_517573 [Mycena belliarum]|uniref:Uncharacterized protein n=1 Tax=Mycena belliarum TaxID=1033014 RepID=A0AAD6TVX7_9AGAR|nr:hypothetical protein B0H15DRAFT_517573 [Mycena belliae]
MLECIHRLPRTYIHIPAHHPVALPSFFVVYPFPSYPHSYASSRSYQYSPSRYPHPTTRPSLLLSGLPPRCTLLLHPPLIATTLIHFCLSVYSSSSPRHPSFVSPTHFPPSLSSPRPASVARHQCVYAHPQYHVLHPPPPPSFPALRRVPLLLRPSSVSLHMALFHVPRPAHPLPGILILSGFARPPLSFPRIPSIRALSYFAFPSSWASRPTSLASPPFIALPSHIRPPSLSPSNFSCTASSPSLSSCAHRALNFHTAHK